MNTLKETNVKYTTRINSNNDKTINIKSSNGVNVTNVYDGNTGKFKYCYDHNKQCIKSYMHNGELYKRIDYSRYDNDFNNNHSRYDKGYSKYNNGFNNGYSRYDNDFDKRYSRYNDNFNERYNNGFNNGYSKRNKGYW